ncbi:hypothetical protein LIT25_00965 [Bacillus sp. F19]|nr:hypothetical protein LIT25_00965 [Bacillus sp. F19]
MSDLKINYGILDHIIGQLYIYTEALNSMNTSLSNISAFLESNRGESIDAWEEMIKNSKENIKSYKTQVEDLLSLFENYVADTTTFITPIARNAMMQVDRYDIWANLENLETGILKNVPIALKLTYMTPTSFFSFTDPTEQEKDKSEENKAKMKRIRHEIEVSKNRLDKKMDELWDLYHSKIVKFENTDVAYSDKAAHIKGKYTSFLEGTVDIVEIIFVGAWDLLKGLVIAVYEIVKGVLTIVVDIGVVSLSGWIPDEDEPDFLKKEAYETYYDYKAMIQQLINDPTDVLFESPFQSITDTVEEEGIMYVAGGTLSSFVPIVGGLKLIKARVGIALEGADGQNLMTTIGKADKSASTIKYLEDMIRNEVNEHGVIFDRNGNVISNLITDGHRSKIDLSPYKNQCKDAIFTHNHPQNGHFSFEDIETAMNFDMAEIRATLPNGVTFSMKRGANGWNQSAMNDLRGVFQKAYQELKTDPKMIKLQQEGNKAAINDMFMDTIGKMIGGEYNVFR